MVKLSNDELHCISAFERITGATATDCMMHDEGIVFLLSKGDVGKAIGKKGANIEKARSVFGKNIRVFEESDDPQVFVQNLFSPIPVRNLNIREKNNRKTATVTIDSKYRGSAIGRGGERIKLVRALLLRRFDMELKLLTA